MAARSSGPRRAEQLRQLGDVHRDPRALSRAKLAQENNVLAEINKTIERRCCHYRGQMQMDVTFTYRCPRTSLQVQGRIAADHATDCEIYEPVTCTACGRVHLINPKTGKVLATADE